jgi:hypothetical protein
MNSGAFVPTLLKKSQRPPPTRPDAPEGASVQNRSAKLTDFLLNKGTFVAVPTL